jgi:hypothetical protein
MQTLGEREYDLAPFSAHMNQNLPLPHEVHIFREHRQYAIEIEYIQEDVLGDVVDRCAICGATH